jgi:hypothetical protein
MRSEKEIKDKIKELESDERLNYVCATIFENAPLALVQLELETKISTLYWVLDINNKKKVNR